MFNHAIASLIVSQSERYRSRLPLFCDFRMKIGMGRSLIRRIGSGDGEGRWSSNGDGGGRWCILMRGLSIATECTTITKPINLFSSVNQVKNKTWELVPRPPNTNPTSTHLISRTSSNIYISNTTLGIPSFSLSIGTTFCVNL